jgi:hypothetical protein
VPFVTFEVESYTVLTRQHGTQSSGAWRNLSLTSPSNSQRQSGPGNSAGQRCRRPRACSRKADFGEWYDMLRNERPLTCGFAYAGPDYDPSQPTRELWWIELYTGLPEPPGEGPEEVQAMRFPAEFLRELRTEQGDG